MSKALIIAKDTDGSFVIAKDDTEVLEAILDTYKILAEPMKLTLQEVSDDIFDNYSELLENLDKS